MKDALSKQFFSTVGLEGYILVILCCGMSPFISFFQLLLQVILLGPFRIVSSIYLKWFEKIVQTQYEKENKPESNNL